nr:hypothetical protein BaRGS_010400 [Batillaria attramentaria]
MELLEIPEADAGKEEVVKGVVANVRLFEDVGPNEAEAAVAAGWRSALVIRPGNDDLTDEHLQNFACIEQFDELYGDEDDEDIKRLHQA